MGLNIKLSNALKGNKNAVGNTGGRPQKFTPQMIEQVFKIASLGHTDQKIALFFGISERTLNYWKIQHIEFNNALQRGKTIADGKVAQSLFLMATGFRYEAVKVFLSNGQPLKVKYQRQVLPNITAQIYWLKCRQPDKWKF